MPRRRRGRHTQAPATAPTVPAPAAPEVSIVADRDVAADVSRAKEERKATLAPYKKPTSLFIAGLNQLPNRLWLGVYLLAIVFSNSLLDVSFNFGLVNFVIYAPVLLVPFLLFNRSPENKSSYSFYIKLAISILLYRSFSSLLENSILSSIAIGSTMTWAGLGSILLSGLLVLGYVIKHAIFPGIGIPSYEELKLALDSNGSDFSYESTLRVLRSNLISIPGESVNSSIREANNTELLEQIRAILNGSSAVSARVLTDKFVENIQPERHFDNADGIKTAFRAIVDEGKIDDDKINALLTLVERAFPVVAEGQTLEQVNVKRRALLLKFGIDRPSYTCLLRDGANVLQTNKNLLHVIVEKLVSSRLASKESKLTAAEAKRRIEEASRLVASKNVTLADYCIVEGMDRQQRKDVIDCLKKMEKYQQDASGALTLGIYFGSIAWDLLQGGVFIALLLLSPLNAHHGITATAILVPGALAVLSSIFAKYRFSDYVEGLKDKLIFGVTLVSVSAIFISTNAINLLIGSNIYLLSAPFMLALGNIILSNEISGTANKKLMGVSLEFLSILCAIYVFYNVGLLSSPWSIFSSISFVIGASYLFSSKMLSQYVESLVGKNGYLKNALVYSVVAIAAALYHLGFLSAPVLLFSNPIVLTVIAYAFKENARVSYLLSQYVGDGKWARATIILGAGALFAAIQSIHLFPKAGIFCAGYIALNVVPMFVTMMYRGSLSTDRNLSETSGAATFGLSTACLGYALCIPWFADWLPALLVNGFLSFHPITIVIVPILQILCLDNHNQQEGFLNRPYILSKYALMCFAAFTIVATNASLFLHANLWQNHLLALVAFAPSLLSDLMECSIGAYRDRAIQMQELKREYDQQPKTDRSKEREEYLRSADQALSFSSGEPLGAGAAAASGEREAKAESPRSRSRSRSGS